MAGMQDFCFPEGEGRMRGGPGKTQDAYWHLSLHSTDRETEGLRSEGLVYSSRAD